MDPSDEVSRPELEEAIRNWIIDRNAERNRVILTRRLFDGIGLEDLAEEFDMSVSQIKRIIYSGTDKIYRHL